VSRPCYLLLVLVAALGARCAPALADGDPASDFLLEEQVFLPAQAADSTQPPSTAQRALISTVRAANSKGFAIRIAIIPSNYDLGSVTQLWRKPQTYARFLGVELSLAYKGRLLVVMPNGFGFQWPGHQAGAAERTLAQVPIGAGEGGEVRAASNAVRLLAAGAGVSVARPAQAGGRPAWLPAAVAALAAALLAFAGLRAAQARRHTAPGARAPRGPSQPAPAEAEAQGTAAELARVLALAADAAGEPPPVRLASGVRRWRRPAYAVPVLAVLIAAAAAAPVIAGSGHGKAKPAPRPSAPEPAAEWAAGQRPAPDFALTDQDGRRVSPSSYRGRPVIITFIDPLCRNLCPLEAHVLNQLVRSLPAAQRPEIIAVSVDLWADTRADLLEDYSNWSLVPQWRWAVGTPPQLESVWDHYAEEVDVETKRIAGTTVHFIGHDEMAYLIDSRGDERALFVWPFKPADVERRLRQLRGA
jgi:cytochrome oxidase Cu insertion factor (SCO1/SenC/PrrC family)